LVRVSQQTASASRTPYKHNAAGTGVNAYIIDTGILTTHSEFSGGRATFGYSFFTDRTDCNGHGTHVAGTVGGTTYGLAKGVSLIAVKVLDCAGSGSLAGIIAGVDWVTNDHKSKGRSSNANMSLGGGNMPTLCTAITASWNAGVAYVAAAGNSDANACNTSPANCANIITVGATQTDTGFTTTTRSTFSNWGNCLTTFAPGTNITSAWNNGASRTISGTSMAAPHIAGYVSLLQERSPGSNPNAIYTQITSTAAKGVVNLNCAGKPSGCTASPNLFLYSGC